MFTRELYQVAAGTRALYGVLPTGSGPRGDTPVVSLFWSLAADQLDAWRMRGLEAWKREVLALDPRIGFVLDTITEPEQLTFARYRDVRMREWHDRGVVFIGDAAHATSPQLGQGANLALVDAMVLADAVAEAPGDAAFALYSRQRRRHLRHYQFMTRALTPFFQSSSRLHRLVARLGVPDRERAAAVPQSHDPHDGGCLARSRASAVATRIALASPDADSDDGRRRSRSTGSPIAPSAGWRDGEIVSRRPDRSLSRTTYGAVIPRARRLARALVGAGDQARRSRRDADVEPRRAPRGVLRDPARRRGVLHTLNLRLHPDEIAFIANDAAIGSLIVDDVLLPLFDKVVAAGAKFERVIVVGNAGAHEPYEAFLAGAPDVALPELAEPTRSASATRAARPGGPRASCTRIARRCCTRWSSRCPTRSSVARSDTLLPVVPMFHVNAWGLPYVGAMVGAKLVFPGPHLDPPSLLDLMAERARHRRRRRADDLARHPRGARGEPAQVEAASRACA